MTDTTTPPDGGTPTGGTPGTKKAAKYKAMVVKKTPATSDDQPTSLMVQKADGSIGPWGNDTTATKKTVVTPASPKKDYYEGYSTPGSGSMRYHQ